MEQLKAKLKKQGGFTMVELLIVVAIIAILVAVSIPMMNSVLEKSRHAVDQANERDAVALGAMMLLKDENITWGADNTVTYEYKVDENQIGYLGGTAGTTVTSKCDCGGTADHATATAGVGKGRPLSVKLTKATATTEAKVEAVWGTAP